MIKTILLLLITAITAFAELDRVVLIVDRTGKPITWIDEAAWLMPIDSILGQRMLKEFVSIELPREKLPKIQEWMQPVGITYPTNIDKEPVKTADYNDRAALCDISKLATETKITDLATKVTSKTTVKPIIDATKLDEAKYMIPTITVTKEAKVKP